MIEELFYYYHFHWWCHRQHHLRLKRTWLMLTVLSLILLAAGNIVGPLISNVWVLAGLTWASVVLKGFMEYRKYETKVDLSRVAYTSYAKGLVDLHPEELHWTHKMMIDLAPVVPDRLRHQYQRPDHVDGNIKSDLVTEVNSHGKTSTT